jgi:hypothetical protein
MLQLPIDEQFAIIEAPTGTGKTEAALIWASRLVEAGDVDDAAMKAQLAEASLIDWRRPYREALVNEWLPTRLGDGTVTVAVRNLASPFTGEDINALPVPARWLRGATPPTEPIEVHDGRLMIAATECTYDRLGLLKTSSNWGSA